MKLYRAVVENNKDPKQVSRVQVRIMGIHTQEESGELEGAPNSDLPWAEVIGSTAFGLSGGVGVTSVLQDKTWVWVQLEDDDPNRPIITGTIQGIKNGEPDTSKAGRGDLTDPSIAKKNDNIDVDAGEPEQTPSEYTLSQTIRTPTGHMIELDDTPGNERIQFLDASGNYYQMSIANIVEKAVGDKLQIIQKNLLNFTSGAVEFNASGNAVFKNDVLIEGKLQVLKDIKTEDTVYDEYSSLRTFRETYDRHHHIGNLGYPTSEAIISDPGDSTPDVVITYA